ADVRRMLLTMRTLTEGGRAFATYVGQQLDIAKYAEAAQEREAAQRQVALLTPVAKAFFTDNGLESCVLGQQVFGGHGYIREWGQEQLVRDVRIAQIYEGTNGIQALDLLGRKVVADGGQALAEFTAQIRSFCEGLTPYREPLLKAVTELESLSQWLCEQAAQDPNAVGAASVEYLQVFGYVAYAYMWARMEAVASEHLEQDRAFYEAKRASAAFFFARLLPRTLSLQASIRAGSTALFAHAAEQF
ncbi:MAG: acyl-CoA dehydrogenase C-terminal domain-containing protein, partial [Pseudomonas sp.]